MKLYDKKGKHVGSMGNDLANILVGDVIFADKPYIVKKRVWNSATGGLYGLIVDEMKGFNDLTNE